MVGRTMGFGNILPLKTEWGTPLSFEGFFHPNIWNITPLTSY